MYYKVEDGPWARISRSRRPRERKQISEIAVVVIATYMTKRRVRIGECDVHNTSGLLSSKVNRSGWTMRQRNNFDGSFYAWTDGPSVRTCSKCAEVFLGTDLVAMRKKPLKERDRCLNPECDGRVNDDPPSEDQTIAWVRFQKAKMKRLKEFGIEYKKRKGDAR